MTLFPSHSAAVAFVADLCNLWSRGYDGEPLDMAERAGLSPDQLWFYRAGQAELQREVALS
jgi:hypothetical protein